VKVSGVVVGQGGGDNLHEKQQREDGVGSESSGQGAASAMERMKSQHERRTRQAPAGLTERGWPQDGR
jgi:hypothetical protein